MGRQTYGRSAIPKLDKHGLVDAPTEVCAHWESFDNDLLAVLVADVQDYAILMLDPDGRVMSWNSGAERIKGYTAKQIIGRHFSEFYPPADVAAGKPGHQLKIAAAMNRVEDEGWRVRRDGSLFWANVVITAIRDRDGALRGFGKVTRDLTERRAADMAVRSSRELLAGVLTAATEFSVIATDLDGVITLFNTGAERMLGYRAEELVGRHTPELLYDRDELTALAKRFGREVGAGLLAEDARGGEPYIDDFTYIRKDGSRLPVQVVLTAIIGEDSRPTGFVRIGRDVRIEKKALADAQDAERRWRALVDRLPDTSVLVVDSDMQYRVAVGAGLVRQRSPAAAGIFLADTTSPVNARIMTNMVQKAFDGVESTTEMCSSSTGKPHQVHVVPLPPYEGKPEALIVARELELAKAEERLRRLFNEVPNGIAVTTSDGVMVQVNDALCALVGRSAADLVLQPVGLLNGGTTQSFLAGLIADVPSSPAGRTTGVGQLNHKAGHLVDVSVVVSRFPDTTDAGQLLISLVDFSERRRYEAQLVHLADHDPLTGLGNRRLFDTEVASHLARCRRDVPKGALLVLDLDNFKQVNDTLGHAAGDQLIISTANVMKARLRESDVFARLGGDEFAVLLPDADVPAARAVAAELVTLVRDNVTSFDHAQQRRVTVSIGVVMIDRADQTPDELLTNADLIMYDAKEAGRDQYAFLDKSRFAQPRTGAKLAWADRIRVALENNRFVLHAQPIINLTTDKITGAELLLRMVDDDGQLIPPGQFIHVAELCGMATQLDTWVFNNSIRILEDLHRIDPDFHLEVNLSGHSVGDPQLAKIIGNRLRTAQIDTTKFVFEITETAAIANIGS